MAPWSLVFMKGKQGHNHCGFLIAIFKKSPFYVAVYECMYMSFYGKTNLHENTYMTSPTICFTFFRLAKKHKSWCWTLSIYFTFGFCGVPHQWKYPIPFWPSLWMLLLCRKISSSYSMHFSWHIIIMGSVERSQCEEAQSYVYWT